jgi:hypothetical protein
MQVFDFSAFFVFRGIKSGIVRQVEHGAVLGLLKGSCWMFPDGYAGINLISARSGHYKMPSGGGGQ